MFGVQWGLKDDHLAEGESDYSLNDTVMADNLISGHPYESSQKVWNAQNSKGRRDKVRRQTYPGHKGVGSLGPIGGHDGIQVLMQQGPYEYYAVPIAQCHRYEQLQAHLQCNMPHEEEEEEEDRKRKK